MDPPVPKRHRDPIFAVESLEPTKGRGLVVEERRMSSMIAIARSTSASPASEVGSGEPATAWPAEGVIFHPPSSPPSLSTVPLIGVAVNAALATIKILAGFFGNSYALIADGIESTSDIVTSLVAWGGLRVSVAPADERHPYGYGKAEALAGIVASIALLAAAAMIAFQSVREILTPHHLPHWSTLLVLVLVVATKIILARWIGGIGLIGGPGYEPADDWAALLACAVIVFKGLLMGRPMRKTFVNHSSVSVGSPSMRPSLFRNRSAAMSVRGFQTPPLKKLCPWPSAAQNST